MRHMLSFRLNNSDEKIREWSRSYPKALLVHAFSAAKASAGAYMSKKIRAKQRSKTTPYPQYKSYISKCEYSNKRDCLLTIDNCGVLVNTD